jgi:hypothetical protein
MSVTIGRIAKAVIQVGLVFGVLAGGFWVVTHRQDVLDWWYLRTTQPTADVVAMADATAMIDRGRELFYVSEPQVQDSDQFNQSCSDVGEGGSVLGCYAARKIYIFNVADPRLPHVKEVTAAHEMLHAVYERLDSAAKQRVDNMVLAAADTLKNDASLQDVMKIYARTEPGEMANELHSILGTEYRNLPTDLEAYYKQYFSDRTVVVGFAEAYKSVFEASKARLQEFDAKLESLKQQITDLENDLKNRRAELDSESARLQILRNTDVAAYNAAVPGYNSKVRSFNTLVKQYNGVVASYNSTVVERNKEAAAQNDLYHSLDSKYQTL